MDESSQASVYEQMRAFAKQFRYVYEVGVTIEIQEVFFRFQQQGKVKDFLLVFDQETNHYKVTVTLEDASLATVNTLFGTFFQFVAYKGATLTVRKETEQGIHYEFASFTERGRGFYCEVDFMAEAVGTRDEGQQREQGEPSRAVRSGRNIPELQPDIKWKFNVGRSSAFPLLAAQGIIYAMCEDEDCYALDAEQGTVRWQWKPGQPGFWVPALPEVANGVLSVPVKYFQDGQRTLCVYAIAAQSGQVLKCFSISSQWSTGFNISAIQNGVVYLNAAPTVFAGAPSMCQAIDLETEERKWLVDLGKQSGFSALVVTNARLYLMTADARKLFHGFGDLHAFGARTGEEIWRHRFERGLAQPDVVAGTEVFIVNTTLEVLAASSGILQWSVPDLNIALNGPLAVNDEMVFITYQQSASDAGREAWQKKNEAILAGGPLLLGEIMAVDRASRQPRWKATLVHGESFIERPMISGNVLYTTWKKLDIRGEVTHATLFALDVQTGQEYWRFEADDLGAPLAVNDRVFIRGREGEEECIYALSCESSKSV